MPAVIADSTIAAFVKQLSERIPAPGGGAAAAVCAAFSCAAGAMAARYTTGEKWAKVSAEAQALAETLDEASRDCLRLADEDAHAYGAVSAARKAKDSAGQKSAERKAMETPADLLALCAIQAAGLSGFISACNPNVLSDVKVAIHGLAGAGRAAWQTLLVNKPDDTTRKAAQVHLDALAKAEARACPGG